MLSTARRQRILSVTKNIDHLMRRRYNRRRIYRHKKQFANILVDEKDVIKPKPIQVQKESSLSSESLQQDCSICLENMHLKDAQNISCGHVFHQICIQAWSKQAQNVCPLCRNQFVVVTSKHTNNHTSNDISSHTNHYYPRPAPINLIDRHVGDSQSQRDRHVIVID